MTFIPKNLFSQITYVLCNNNQCIYTIKKLSKYILSKESLSQCNILPIEYNLESE